MTNRTPPTLPFNIHAQNTPDTIWVPQPWQVDPSRGGNVAALYGDCLRMYSPDNHLIPQALALHEYQYMLADHETIQDMARLLLSLKIETLLLVPHPDSTQDRYPVHSDGLHPFLGAASDGLSMRLIGGRDLTAQLSGLIFQHADGGPMLTCYYLDDRDPFGFGAFLATVQPIERQKTAANAFLLAQWALGLRIRFTPSYSGQMALRASMHRAIKENPDRFRPPSEWWREAIRNLPAQYFHWQARALATGETFPDNREALHVWSYDRNWSFLSSARRVPLGEPVKVLDYTGQPGVYFLSAQGLRGEDDRFTPGWFRADDGSYPREVYNVWAWEPQVRAAMRAGWSVKIKWGYAYPDSYDLRPWNDHMWKARKLVRTVHDRVASPAQQAAASGAENAIKRIALTAIGRLNQRTGHVLMLSDGHGGRFHNEDVLQAESPVTRSDLLRPEWWSSIISGASERLITLLRQYPGASLAGYIDAAYMGMPIPEIIEAGRGFTAGGWHIEADGVLVPGEAWRAGLSPFVNAVAQGKRAGRVTHAN